MGKRLQFAIRLILVLANLIAFQNCAQPARMTAIPTLFSVAESGGDGRPYEGKIYVDTSSQCLKNDEAFARIDYKSNSLALLTRDNCKDLNPAIELLATDFKVDVSNDTLIYHSRIFRADSNQGPQVIRTSCNLSGFNIADRSVKNQIDYSYCLTLGRLADGAGMASYESAIANGQTFLWILTSQVGSGEFNSKYQLPSMSDGNYVILIYRLALNRDPNSSELYPSIDRLGSGSIARQDFASEVFNTDEFRQLYPLLF